MKQGDIMNRNIIIIAIIVILVAIVGVFALTQMQSGDEGMLNTQIKFLSQETIKNGQAVEFELNDEKGQHLANQNVTIIFTENGENQTYSIITDTYGKGSLVMNNEEPGSYDVEVRYNGSAKYHPTSAKTTITIEGEQTQTEESNTQAPTSTNSSAGTSLYNGNSSASSDNLHYDSQYNFYYDDNGIIRGGQSDGMSAEYVKNAYESGNMIDADGNLQ